MARYIILAQDECTASALGAWIEVLGETAAGEQRIVWKDGTAGAESGTLAYEWLVRKLESAARMSDGSIALNEVVVLVDSINPQELRATSEGAGWSHLVAMLILTFPEIKWIFGVIAGGNAVGKQSQVFPAEQHCLASLLVKARRDPLLDPTGLRNYVRCITNVQSRRLRKDGFAMPVRRRKAAAIDDEKSFAYMHAYTAYRFGFRCDAVTSWALMEELFGGDSNVPHRYEVLLEDMNLKFPDKPNWVELVLLGDRAARCLKLSYGNQGADSSTCRVLITTGKSDGADTNLEANEEFLRRNKNGNYRIVHKPVGGMLDLWRKCGFFQTFCGSGVKGNAPRFKLFMDPSVKAGAAGHGSPGKLMLIAEVLLRRAEVFRANACTVKDYIKGATLATEGMELLGGRTPTLTLAALELKHEYEVRAECAFIGAGYHFDVQARIEEIDRVVGGIAKWFIDDVRAKAKCDAVVAILNRVAAVFRQAGQFEEEQEALVKLRREHRGLLIQQSRSKPFQILVNRVLQYAEWLLASFGNFVKTIGRWLLGIVVAYLMLGFVAYCLDPCFSVSWMMALRGTMWMALPDTIGQFFGGSIASDVKDAPSWFNGVRVAISCVAVVAGAFHIGVFISYLYSVISRR